MKPRLFVTLFSSAASLQRFRSPPATTPAGGLPFRQPIRASVGTFGYQRRQWSRLPRTAIRQNDRHAEWRCIAAMSTVVGPYNFTQYHFALKLEMALQ